MAEEAGPPGLRNRNRVPPESRLLLSLRDVLSPAGPPGGLAARLAVGCGWQGPRWCWAPQVFPWWPLLRGLQLSAGLGPGLPGEFSSVGL